MAANHLTMGNRATIERHRVAPRGSRLRDRGRNLVEGFDMSDSTTSPIGDRNPSGLCQCGCGGMTNIIKGRDCQHGRVPGHHSRYISGHNGGRDGAMRPKKVDRYRIDEATGCWIWLLYKDHRGYGIDNAGGRACSAHRRQYEIAHGPIPRSFQVHHTCGNSLCCNPDHLIALDARDHGASVARIFYWKNRALTAEAKLLTLTARVRE